MLVTPSDGVILTQTRPPRIGVAGSSLSPQKMNHRNEKGAARKDGSFSVPVAAFRVNHGDLKATQGDTGHAQVDMITRIYAHILDEDRKVNAQRFNTAFYGPDLRQVKAPSEQAPQLDLQDLIRQLQESPELAQALAGIISAGGGQRCDKGDDEAEPANSAISRRRFLLAE